ncbi:MULTISPECIES: hydantoinase/oxoprolinase family protein [Paracoccus]|uniref:hydantoinase/oxoprolinase family protein n=1 Tax=Paracoccus TaxID=265 RepID=UPI00140A3E9B|nr:MULTISPECIES: hydantoinase/oxoprolinase family protein [Paracoccus]
MGYRIGVDVGGGAGGGHRPGLPACLPQPGKRARRRRMLAETAPERPVAPSSGTWPVRGYERTITAVISDYVQPRVAHCHDRFEAALAGKSVAVPAHITKSNGGVRGIGQARVEPVQMILSGTASGVIGAGWLGNAAFRASPASTSQTPRRMWR